MRQYTIVGGVNGVGKTTFIKSLKDQGMRVGEIIDPDSITADEGGNALIGCKIALKRIRKCIADNSSFLQETTLSGYKTETTIKEAKKQGYRIRLIYIGLDTVDESLHRIQSRVKLGGHDIPSNVVIRRFQHRWESVAKVLPYCDEAKFYDNSFGFVQVAEYSNGEYHRIGSHSCPWADQLGKHLSQPPNNLTTS